MVELLTNVRKLWTMINNGHYLAWCEYEQAMQILGYAACWRGGLNPSS